MVFAMKSVAGFLGNSKNREITGHKSNSYQGIQRGQENGSVLQVRSLTKNFGGIKAVNNVDMDIYQGEILGLIGPNGAGKSTLVNLSSGVLRPDTGRVLLMGEDVTGFQPHILAKKGMVRSFQHMALWQDFTVMDNMRVAFHIKSATGFFETLFSTRSYRKKREKFDQEITEVLRFVGMTDLKDQPAATLSHGYQRSLSLAISFVMRPRLLLLDEPLAALSPERSTATIDLIRRIREQGTTILIIEHNMKVIFSICDRIVVLNSGIKIAEGSPSEIRENSEVITVYLGVANGAT